MLKSYFKLAFRNIRRNKGYSFINIAGLAVGLACCLLILLWVQDELGFDQFHAKADRLARVVETQHYAGGQLFPVAVTPGPLAAALKNEVPEVINAMRYTTAPRMLGGYKDKQFYEDAICFADPSLFEMFSFPMLQGDPKTAFEKPTSVVLTRKTAARYFGSENPLGKTISFDGRFDLSVSGVIADIPSNSHLAFDLLMPFQIIETSRGDSAKNWGNNSFFTYIELQKNARATDVEPKLTALLKKHSPQTRTTLHIQPLKKIHLYSPDFAADLGGHGDIKYVAIFSCVALFVLVIACINFMNLATARSARRAREVGLRKTSGALRWSLIRQFLGESVVLVLIALAVAVGLVILLLPAFNALAAKDIRLDLIQKGRLGLGLAAATILTGLFAGAYPALFLSSFQPANVLKGGSKSGPKSSGLRKFLVVVQFALSIFMIISTAAVHGQLRFIRDKKLGFDKDGVVTLRMGMDIRRQFEAFKAEALKNPRITDVAASDTLPTLVMNSTSGATWPGKNPKDEMLFHFLNVDFDFLRALRMDIREGRGFSKEFPTDLTKAYIVNEEAVRIMGLTNPVGKPFTIFGQAGTIIGVVKNFHFKSMSVLIEPIVLRVSPSHQANYLIVRIRGDIAPALAAVESAWRKSFPQHPFRFSFLDAEYGNLYRSEMRMGRIFDIFAGLAVLIACLGLLGLASFTAEQRTREIGIRKVLGASVRSIVLLLSREFCLLVGLANLAAWPAAYYFMSRWLGGYAYRASLPILVFFGAAILALMTALATVGAQAVRAASVHPAVSIRND